jgi:Ca2+-binding EF-hand superfamily protein
MKEIWNKLDLNRDGVVKTAEVDVFLKNLNSTLSDEDRKEIIKLIDKYILFQQLKKNYFNKKIIDF